MDIEINTIVALAIHATTTLNEESSIRWLTGITELTLDDFNTSRRVLGIAEPQRRNNTESAASDIVRYLQEGKPVPKTFVIDPRDLSKIPGLSNDCLGSTARYKPNLACCTLGG